MLCMRMGMRHAPTALDDDYINGLGVAIGPLIQGFSKDYDGPDFVEHVVRQIEETLGAEAIDTIGRESLKKLVIRSTPPQAVNPEVFAEEMEARENSAAPAPGRFTQLIQQLAAQPDEPEVSVDRETIKLHIPAPSAQFHNAQTTFHRDFEEQTPISRPSGSIPSEPYYEMIHSGPFWYVRPRATEDREQQEQPEMMVSLDSALSKAGLQLKDDGLFYPLDGFTWVDTADENEYYNFAIRALIPGERAPQGKATPQRRPALAKPADEPRHKTTFIRGGEHEVRAPLPQPLAPLEVAAPVSVPVAATIAASEEPIDYEAVARIIQSLKNHRGPIESEESRPPLEVAGEWIKENVPRLASNALSWVKNASSSLLSIGKLALTDRPKLIAKAKSIVREKKDQAFDAFWNVADPVIQYLDEKLPVAEKPTRSVFEVIIVGGIHLAKKAGSLFGKLKNALKEEAALSRQRRVTKNASESVNFPN